jgi:hypothetical protein
MLERRVPESALLTNKDVDSRLDCSVISTWASSAIWDGALLSDGVQGHV